MHSTLFLSILLVLSSLVWTAWSFIKNIRAAKQINLPYTFSLVTEFETWAYLTDPLLRWMYRDYLLERGQGWPRWARFMIKDWMYEDKYRAHQEFGDTFLVVSPGGMICYTADADVSLSICQRRRDFIKPREKMKMIEPFGPNVVSSEGSLWRFHYRITAPPFKDEANRIVWAETKRQATALKQSWMTGDVEALKSDVYSVGVNVMAAAGFGRPQYWTADKAPPKGHQLSLVDSLSGIVAYLPHILLLPKWALKLFADRAYNAYTEFDSYTREFIAEEKVRTLDEKAADITLSGNLLSAMLATGAAEQKSSRERVALTDDEILGNIFMFYMAGYDTTANTIIFSCVALALYPTCQDILLAELDRIEARRKAGGRSELSYETDLPQFRYMLAFLYETLRIFPVVLPIGRITSGPQTLSPSPTSSTITLPDSCGTIVNITGIHYNPSCWNSPHIFEPKRWLSPSPNTYDPEDDDIDVPSSTASIPGHKRGTFMTFSEGPRACLGRRFAQAEYVAFFAELLRGARIELAPGVSREETERLYRSCSAGSPISLQPPASVKLRLVEREVR
ncbi:Cytochrome P450-like protein 47 [Elsinoe fawcettii]|nr:Cytochrome P450-like protein 47 [Elsinoe fawcettii]